MKNNNEFDIPVVLFLFKRDKVVEIVKRIAKIKPQKIYLLADEGRDAEEKALVQKCRELVENEINWECEIVKNYATENRGVYENIAEGAKWVLRREKWAIFLEDDNLPEISFFRFCKEMLLKYEDNQQILWVCGTNYLEKYRTKENYSYVFTNHMLPCGWATWASKFEKNYDGELKLCENPDVLKEIPSRYCNKKVFKQYQNDWMAEYKRIKNGMKPLSWDYQMDFSIKAHNLLGICPCNNQIKNIGVDQFSVHGGTSMDAVMTRRFCGMNSVPITFPLVHPEKIEQDHLFEKKIGKILLYPLKHRIIVKVSKLIRRVFSIPDGIGIKVFLLKKVKSKNEN